MPTAYTQRGRTYPGSDVRRFPEEGSPQDLLLAFRDRVINPWASYRNQRMAEKALWMQFYMGQQWSELDYEMAFDGIRGAILRDNENPNLPRPITNEVDPAVEQTVIALVKRKWTARCQPQSSDPAIKAAAQVSEDLCRYRLRELAFDEKRRQLGFHFVTAGDGLIYTAQDKTYTLLKPIGAPTAVWCEGCETKLYSADVPVANLRQGYEGQPFSRASMETASPLAVDPVSGEPYTEEMATLNRCPICEDSRSLLPYTPTEDEINSETVDIFGRPLSVDAPQYRSTLEIDLPHEFYPENQGLFVGPYSARRFGRRKVRSLEWVEERYPHLVHLIPPQPVHELLRGDPMLGDWSLLGGWSPAYDQGLLDYHVNFDEVWETPSLRHPYGRYMTAVANLVCEEGRWLEEGKDEDGRSIYVPRAAIHWSRCKLSVNAGWGRGVVATQVSPQNRLNGLDGQLIESRLRTGSPNLYVQQDQWLGDQSVMQDDAYGLGKIVLLGQSMDGSQPVVQQGVLMSPDVYLERDRIIEHMQRSVGPNDATRGNAPKNIGTTSGLEFLVAQDEASQAVREDELVGSGERAWSHLIRMDWVLQRDESAYRVLGPNKVWSWKQYKGQMLRGQVEIDIERGPSISKGITRRESAREAIADKLVDPIGNPVIQRRLLEEYGLDADLAPEISSQVDHADRVYIDFRDKNIIRMQDTLDDPKIHFLVLADHLRSEEMQDLADRAGWEEIKRGIAGWQQDLAQLQALEQASLAFYGRRLEGEEAEVEYARASVSYDEQLAIYNQEKKVYDQRATDPVTQAAAAQGGVGIQPPVPPVEPPPPVALPPLLQDQVMMVWTYKMKQHMQKRMTMETPPIPGAQAGLDDQSAAPPTDPSGMPIDPMAVEMGYQEEPQLDTLPALYSHFRALVEAYRLTAMPLQLPAIMPGMMQGVGPMAGVGMPGAPSAGVPGGGGAGMPGMTAPVPTPAPMGAMSTGGLN